LREEDAVFLEKEGDILLLSIEEKKRYLPFRAIEKLTKTFAGKYAKTWEFQGHNLPLNQPSSDSQNPPG
jgi:hypothetical protein